VTISSRGADACEQARQELAPHGDVTAVAADLSTEAECQRLAATLSGPLNILVNNAGATWGAPLLEFPESAWDKVLDLNLKSPFFLTRAVLPQL
jgi:NAD(P)-dependent dehydrogenase (short-subunit alcohol dehydrogenase family)